MDEREYFMKNIICTLLLLSVLSAPALAQERLKGKSDESLFLGLQKTGLGSLNELEEKKKFFETVKLEKAKIQESMLGNVYENALAYYRSGNYEDAKALASKILSIDPNHSDAQMLLEASSQLRGSANPTLSEKTMLEDRFRLALSMYADGRIVEAYKKMEEVVKLSPNNIKAKYWHARMRNDLRSYYNQKGADAYKAGDLNIALDNFYSALFINTRDAYSISWITRIEDELRQQKANAQLRSALELYSKGNLKGAYEGLQRTLEIQPGDSKAHKLLAEVKNEIESGYITAGKKLYGARRYTEAMAEWVKARPYSSDLAYLDKLAWRAREQMKVESEEKRRRADDSARRAREEEARRAREAQEQKQAEADAARKGVSVEEVVKKPQGITAENRLAGQQHYLEGLKFFQNSNYEKARSEWSIARQLDPENSDAAAGLKRIEQILAGGQ